MVSNQRPGLGGDPILHVLRPGARLHPQLPPCSATSVLLARHPQLIVHDAMPYEATVHHRRSLRLQSWDYSERGAYFVTICTHERAVLFEDAQIKHELQMAWRSIGRYSNSYPGEFVVMPNHIHGIIWIPGATVSWGAAQADNGSRSTSTRHPRSVASSFDPRAAPLREFAVDAGSLPAIVRAFKSNTTKRVNALRLTPGVPVWQRNYYEHVIRDDRELERAREYIIDNPRRWAEDRDNPANTLTAGLTSPP